MSPTPDINRRVVLARRPHGAPTVSDFRIDQTTVPRPSEGQVLLRTLYLSLDPYMRQLMNETPPAYAEASVAVGEPMVGGTVSQVAASAHPDFKVGDLVLANAGWQDYALSDGAGLMRLGDMAQPSLALGLLGMPAFTAYVGLLDIGHPHPGETVVVAAATGAVGSVVGQLAKLKGARVVGIASGTEKCRYAVNELGLDICLDRRDPALQEHLKEVCPNGIDVYFENVGGKVFEAVLPLLNIGARVPVIGLIAHYNDHPASGEQAAPQEFNLLPQFMATILQKRIRVEGMVILDHYQERFDAFFKEMNAWVKSGQIKLREDMVVGLENTPEAFIGMLEGRNFGKQVVRVAEA